MGKAGIELWSTSLEVDGLPLGLRGGNGLEGGGRWGGGGGGGRVRRGVEMSA